MTISSTKTLTVVQLRLKFNDIKAVMLLIIKAQVIQVSRYAFSNSK